MATDPKQPAFPRPGFTDPAGMQDGMTLRDWFAGQALMGFLANSRCDQTFAGKYAVPSAYNLADDMLAEKERRDAE